MMKTGKNTLITMNDIEKKSNLELNVIRTKWNNISDEFNKQIEKACYTGVAIIWVFTVLGDFYFSSKLIFSLLFFITPLIIFFTINLIELYKNYFIYKKAKLKISKGYPLNAVFLNPSKVGLWISTINLFFVILGYILISIYVCREILK